MNYFRICETVVTHLGRIMLHHSLFAQPGPSAPALHDHASPTQWQWPSSHTHSWSPQAHARYCNKIPTQNLITVPSQKNCKDHDGGIMCYLPLSWFWSDTRFPRRKCQTPWRSLIEWRSRRRSRSTLRHFRILVSFWFMVPRNPPRRFISQSGSPVVSH